MTELTTKQCEACRADAPRVTAAQIVELTPQIPEWELLEVDGIQRLSRAYSFDNFEQALSFTNKVGALAEQEAHHPAILTEWGQVTVTWWTHKIRGLHVNDFIMSAKTDEVL
jgi:4a-hydroxytetrahydrobiopterin dehydratase